MRALDYTLGYDFQSKNKMRINCVFSQPIDKNVFKFSSEEKKETKEKKKKIIQTMSQNH